MLNVRITQNYAIESDKAALNFVVKERRTVDPTKAPGYKADPNAPAPVLSERWVDAAYFPVATEGLRLTLDYVRLRAVLADDITDLAELAGALQTQTAAITSALQAEVGGSWPEICVVKAQNQRENSAPDAAGVLAEG